MPLILIFLFLADSLILVLVSVLSTLFYLHLLVQILFSVFYVYSQLALYLHHLWSYHSVYVHLLYHLPDISILPYCLDSHCHFADLSIVGQIIVVS